MATQAEQAIEAIHSVYGSHPGYRAVHAKGTLCKGTFKATPEAASLTRAAHMQGDAVEVVTRFSNGAGDPHRADHTPDGRGMATKFYLPDGSRTDIVALSLPCFFVRNPDDFIKLTRAGKPIPGTQLPGPGVGIFLATHREAWRAARAQLTAKPPQSYATVRYNGIHSFKWIDPSGAERWVRYAWRPAAGEASISRLGAARHSADYLREELVERLGREPIGFELQVTIADEGDPIDDPTVVWPDERERVTVGTLELTGLETGREQEGDILVFDPTRVTDGIELSGDEILRFRSQAYSVSVELRSGVSRPAALDRPS